MIQTSTYCFSFIASNFLLWSNTAQRLHKRPPVLPISCMLICAVAFKNICDAFMCGASAALQACLDTSNQFLTGFCLSNRQICKVIFLFFLQMKAWDCAFSCFILIGDHVQGGLGGSKSLLIRCSTVRHLHHFRSLCPSHSYTCADRFACLHLEVSRSLGKWATCGCAQPDAWRRFTSC